MDVCVFLCAYIHFLGVRRMASCCSLVSCWMLMVFCSLNVVMTTWILVSDMGHMDRGLCWLVMQEDHGLRVG